MKSIQLIPLFISCLFTIACNSTKSGNEICGKQLEYKLRLQEKYGLQFLYDYLQGFECAKSQNKPMLVVFTGYACIGYDVFAMDLIKVKSVRKILKNDFVTVLLHVDDKALLDENESAIRERYTSAGIELDTMRRINTIGHLNSTIQTSIFKDNSQVFFAFVNSKGQNLIQPFSFNKKDPDFFISKLNLALQKWTNQVK